LEKFNFERPNIISINKEISDFIDDRLPENVKMDIIKLEKMEKERRNTVDNKYLKYKLKYLKLKEKLKIL
jgi:hypothetical protein